MRTQIATRRGALSIVGTLMVAAVTLTTPSLAQNPCGEKAKNPCNPCGGKASMASHAVNPCHAKKGTVFSVDDPMARNTVTFTSEAPLEDIVGTSNAIHGYVVFDPRNPKKGVVGRIVIPTGSLTTGIPLRDEHLRQEEWLHAGAYPEISFAIERTGHARKVDASASHTTYEMEVAGPLTIRGKTKDVSVPLKVTYLAESEKTKARMPGDLLAGRATFEVSLEDFGIRGFDGVVGSKVGETIEVSVSIVGSSAPVAAMNPCNPCSGKNPCNPCGKKKG